MSKSAWMQDQQGNFSNDRNDTFDPANGYVGIRLQQGVPLLDRDWNELEDIRRQEMLSLRKNYVGDGSPDDGFRIAATDPASGDFKIMAGRCLVDGFEAENFPAGQDYVLYSEHPDAPALNAPADPRTDGVYLDVWIEEVLSGGGTDPLQNPQDIGVETCVRHKLNWMVRVDEGKAGYAPQDFHHYYPLAEIGWAEGVVARTTDLRSGIEPLASWNRVNRDMEKLRHAVLDAWIEGGDLEWTNMADNVYSLAVQPAVCMINGTEKIYPATTSVAAIMPGKECVVVATGDGRILTMDGDYLTLSRWLADWWSYGKYDASQKYIPLYILERPSVDAALTRTDMREGGAFDALIAAVEEMDRKVSSLTGEQTIAIMPFFSRYLTNAEWTVYMNYASKSTAAPYAYGMLSLHLPAGARITKFRASGYVYAGGGLSVHLGVSPTTSAQLSWIAALYPTGSFDISTGVNYIISDNKCVIYAVASGSSQVDLYGLAVSYVMKP